MAGLDRAINGKSKKNMGKSIKYDTDNKQKSQPIRWYGKETKKLGLMLCVFCFQYSTLLVFIAILFQLVVLL